MKHTNKKGFTIVELVIVIAVIAILAAVLIPNLSSLVKKANESAAMQEADNALKADLILADGDYTKIGGTAPSGETWKGTYTAASGETHAKYSISITKSSKTYSCVFDITDAKWTVTDTTATN